MVAVGYDCHLIVIYDVVGAMLTGGDAVMCGVVVWW